MIYSWTSINYKKMNCKYTNLTKEQIQNCNLPLIPRNKRGFSSVFDMVDIFPCIVHKLKTGCQWKFLFVDIEGFKPSFSWQTFYSFYREWCKYAVFGTMFQFVLQMQKERLDTENLNLDGMHSLVKKSAESVGYQPRKKGRTSNILFLTDGNGIPVASGGSSVAFITILTRSYHSSRAWSNNSNTAESVLKIAFSMQIKDLIVRN